MIRLILEFTRRDFTEKYAGSLLGVFWAFAWPLVLIAIYTLVFSNLMGSSIRPGANSGVSYVIYLVAGIVPWTAFVNTVMRSSTVFVDRKNIVTKVRTSLPTFPIYIVLSESITFGITMLLFLVFLVVVGSPVYEMILLVPLVFLIQQIFAYALGFLMGILYIFVRDIKEIVGMALQIWFWLTPIVYVSDILPIFVQKAMRFNPAFYFIEAYHDMFVYGRYPDMYRLAELAILGHAILLCSYMLFKKMEKDIRDCI